MSKSLVTLLLLTLSSDERIDFTIVLSSSRSAAVSGALFAARDHGLVDAIPV